MSGIVALFQRDGAPVDVALLERMNEAQRYRGPDGERIWHEGSVGLGHTLHKTTLEAEREISPTTLDGRLFITADARVDARDELCERLRGRGIYVRTDVPDPELLLHAYDAWGEDFLQHLLGDFSFALWDAKNRKLVCAVDQLGVKPFFYADRGGLFAASNSLECVRQHPQVRDELNEIAVGDFLLFGCYQTRDITIYEDIVRLLPGHYLVVEASGVRLQRYFSLPEPREVEFARESDVIEQFQELLGKAVKDRLRMPKVAVYMSGGVDSPLVAMTAKKELAKQFGEYDLSAFTSVYEALVPDDERHYTGIAAKSLGISVEFQALDQGELFDWAERTVPPEPRSTGLWGPALDLRSRIAARFSTVLTGFDGDGLCLASVHLHWAERLRSGRMGMLVRDLSSFILRQRTLPPMGIRTRFARFRDGTQTHELPGWLQEDFCQRTSLTERWLSHQRRDVPSSSRELSFQKFAGQNWQGVFDYYDPSLLRKPLDVRHPLADMRVVRFAFGLPAVPWCVDKRLLRECLTSLPRSIQTRPKTPVWVSPVRARLRTRGLSIPGAFESPRLSRFISVPALLKAYPPDDQSALGPWQALQATGFGIWLGLTDGPHRLLQLSRGNFSSSESTC